VYATARGERATVELRDGTRVTLAPGTEIRVAAVGRQIYLNGEAMFSVTHDPKNPFRVTAPTGTTVQDIGTQFDVRAYDKTVRIVVSDGSVSIQGAKPVILTRGTLGVVDSTGAARVTKDVAVDRYLAWSKGTLTFGDTPMRDVIPDLDRWYDIDVRLDNPKLADDRLTVTISDIPADVALDVIARALDASVVRSGQTVTLVSRR
jgi:transmembrane sensor